MKYNEDQVFLEEENARLKQDNAELTRQRDEAVELIKCLIEILIIDPRGSDPILGGPLEEGYNKAKRFVAQFKDQPRPAGAEEGT